MREIIALVRKDLQIEWQTKETLASLLLLGLLTLLILSFAFDPTSKLRDEAAPGALWVAVTFAGVLALGRSFHTERENDCLLGLLLSPVDRGNIYLAKVVANFALMSVAQLGILPVFVLFFDIDPAPPLLGVCASIFLGLFGLAALGSLFAAITAQTKAREVLLPLLMLPLIIPLFIAGVSVTSDLLAGKSWNDVSAWLNAMVAVDVIFLVAGWMLFEYAVQE